MTCQAIVNLAVVTCAGPTIASPTGVYHVGAVPPLVGLATVNVVGDGRPDLMTVARSEFSIRILRGDATFGFAGPIVIPAGNDARSAASGDVNGDDIADVLVIGHDNAIDVRFDLGDGQFGPIARDGLRNHGNHLAIADLKVDRFADVVAAHDGSGRPVHVTAFLGSDAGDLQQVWELGTVDGASTGIAGGDFDHDGKTDVQHERSAPGRRTVV